MKITSIGLLYISLILSSINLYAEKSVIETVVLNQSQYPEKNFLQFKELLLQTVKQQASNKIYGELILSNTEMDNGKIMNESVKYISGGLIRIKGNPKFEKGKKLGDMKITISAYATDNDIANYTKNIKTLQIAEVKKTPKQKEKRDFYGLWSGYIMSDVFGTTKAVITISLNGQSKISFPTLNCGGDLVIKSKDIKYVAFKKFLNYGFDSCEDKNKIILIKDNNNKLKYQEYSESNEKIASGVLYREE